MAVSGNKDILKAFGADASNSDRYSADLSDEKIEITLTLHNIIVGIFNPKINFFKLSGISNDEFMEYMRIDPQEYKDHRKIIVLLCDIREVIDSIIYGNNDLSIVSREALWKRLVDRFDGIDISAFKEYIDAYIQVTASNLGIETKLTDPIQVLKSGIPERDIQGIRIKTPEDILSSIRNIPSILTIITADSGHFYVVGKNMNSHRRELLSMGGNTIKDFKNNGLETGFLSTRKNIIMFPNSYKKEVKKFIFNTYPEPLKIEKTNLKYFKNKLKTYLFSGILYIKYNKLKPIINLEIAKDILSEIWNLSGQLSEEFSQDRREKKLTDEVKKYILKIFIKLNNFTEGKTTTIKLSEKGLLLLISVIFNQIDELNKGIEKEDYNGLKERMDESNRKILSYMIKEGKEDPAKTNLPLKLGDPKTTQKSSVSTGRNSNIPRLDFLAATTSALIEACKRLDRAKPDLSPIKLADRNCRNERINNLNLEQLKYSLALIVGHKDVEKVIEYIEKIEKEWKDSNLNLKDFLVIKGFLTSVREVKKICKTNEMIVSICASIACLKELSKSNKKIQLRIIFFSV